jgi:hypothetical protein
MDGKLIEDKLMEGKLIGESSQIDEKIKNIKMQFFSALDDYKKYYVYYNKNPEVNEFQNYYANSKSQLQQMSKDILLATNSVDKKIELLDSEMNAVSIKLENEKKLHLKMMRLLQNLENAQNGSELLIDDAKEAYNIQYRYNWEMFIGVILIGAITVSMFKPASVSVN